MLKKRPTEIYRLERRGTNNGRPFNDTTTTLDESVFEGWEGSEERIRAVFPEFVGTVVRVCGYVEWIESDR